MKKNFSLLLFCLLLSSLSMAQAPPVRFTHFTVKDGLPQSYGNCLFQDSHGYIWIGTNTGVCRYDGFGFTSFRNYIGDSTSLSSSQISALNEDENGNIWVGTRNGVNVLNPYTGKSRRVAIPHNTTVTEGYLVYNEGIYRDTQNRMWICTNKGLLYYQASTKTLQPYLLSFPDSTRSQNQVFKIYQDKKDGYWASGKEGVLIQFDRTTHRAAIPEIYVKNRRVIIKYVTAFHEDNQGFLWIGTSKDGIYRLNPKTLQAEQFKKDAKDKNSVDTNSIKDIKQDNNGLIWIGTSNRVTIFNPRTRAFNHYSHVPGDPNSLLYNEVYSLLKDREGVMWVGHALGVSKYDPHVNQFQTYTNNPANPNSLSDNRVYPVVEDKDGILWIGTRGGGLNRFDRKTGQFTRFRHDRIKNSLSDDEVWALSYSASTHILWIGTRNDVSRFDIKTNRFTSFLANSASAKHLITNLAIEQSASVWITSDGSGLMHLDTKTGKVETYQNDPADPASLSNNRGYGLLLDRKGRVWVGTDRGLNRFEPHTKTFKRYMPGNSAQSANVNTQIFWGLYEDSNGIIWFGGLSGLYRMDPSKEKFTIYTKKDGLANEVIYNILEDRHGRLWVSTDEGISRFDPVSKTFRNYDQSRGLQSNEFNFSACVIRQTGEFVFGGMHGFNIFHPDSIKDNSYRPPVVISALRRYQANDTSQVYEEDRTVISKKAITLRYDEALLAFEFTAMSFSNPVNNQYTYQLAGLSNQWIPLGTRRNVTFTGLPPGNYVLRIKASNGDGVWNETSTELLITILPPWWQTWWAYCIYFLLMGGAIGSFIAYRSRALRRENRILEEKVAIRTRQVQQQNNEILAQKEEIEAQRDHLEQTLESLQSTQAQLIQKEKLASLGELTAGIAHEIQNPLNFVNNFSEVSAELVAEMQEELDKGDLQEAKFIADDLHQNLQKINHHGQRASSIVKGMLEHSRATTGERQLTDINQLADEYLRLAYHGAKAKNSTLESDYELITDENLPLVNIVPQEIGRVLLNLINNAFYAVNQRAKSETVSYQPKVTVSTKQKDNRIQISVQDNGAGIPAAIKDKIFQPFFTTKPTGEGTGLGLSLSYDIITKGHGGTLEVETKEGEGTEFIVTLLMY